LSTNALIELVDASVFEARSTYLGAVCCYIEPTDAVESSKRNPPSCMENSNTTVAGDPNEGSGLVNWCFRATKFNVLEDLINYYTEPIDTVESYGIPRCRMEVYHFQYSQS